MNQVFSHDQWNQNVYLSQVKTQSDEGRGIFFPARTLDRTIVGLVRSEAFNGALRSYPHCFQKVGVTPIKQWLKMKEDLIPPLNWMESMKPRIMSLAKTFKGGSCVIEPSDWSQGKYCTLFFWNNVPSSDADSSLRNLPLTGDVRV